MEKGLVSIGLPAYNGSKYIRGSLGSLLSQSYKKFELIISDDSSADDTFKICKEYAERYKRIKLVRQSARLGQFGNFRFVAKEAKGAYFMWVAQDDWWDPRFIEVLKSALDSRPDYGVAMSSYARFYDDGEFLAETKFSGPKDITWLGYADVLDMMMKKAPIHKFSYGLFRSELIKKLISRPLPESIAWERVYMCEVAAATHFYSHPEILYKITTYRQNLKTRHGKSDVAGPYFDKFHYTKYIFMIIRRLFTSPIIPFRLKVTLILRKSITLLWFGRGRILHELFPALYKFLRHRYISSALR